METNRYKSVIGQKIKHIRLSHNMTQEVFCNAIELEISNLSNIENGKALASLQTITRILTTFNIEPNDFFDFVNWKNEKEENPINLEIFEHIKTLPQNLKDSLLEILKNMK